MTETCGQFNVTCVATHVRCLVMTLGPWTKQASADCELATAHVTGVTTNMLTLYWSM